MFFRCKTHPGHNFLDQALARTALIALLLSCATARADVIYRETWGRPATPTANLNVTNWGWREFINNGTALAGANGVNGTDNGKPNDVANVNANTNNDGTLTAYPFGWHYHDQNPRALSFTPEYSFNPATYVAGSVVFTWYQGNASTAHGVQLIVRIGTTWYASAQTNFNAVAVANAAAFPTGAELKSVTFDPAAANWRLLNFNGDFNSVSGATVNSSLGNLSVGSAPGADLSGTINAFGLYGDNNTAAGNRRYDTFTIQATPITGTPAKNV